MPVVGTQFFLSQLDFLDHFTCKGSDLGGKPGDLKVKHRLAGFRIPNQGSVLNDNVVSMGNNSHPRQVTPRGKLSPKFSQSTQDFSMWKMAYEVSGGSQ